MTIPTNLSGAGLAETQVGQNTVVFCPLAMCSVAATVSNGSFKQPILLPNYKQIPGTPLGSTLQNNLKELMKQVILTGMAATVGFPTSGHYYGKTGTAEVGRGAGLYTNAWFVAFSDEQTWPSAC